MPPEIQEMLDEGACYRCFGDLDIATMLKIVLTARAVVAADPTADVTPQGLMTWGSCYRCLGLSYGEIMLISLNDMLSQALAA